MGRNSAGAKRRPGTPKQNSISRPQNNLRTAASARYVPLNTWHRDRSALSPAAFPAGLSLAVTYALAGRAERGRAYALAGIVLAGAVGKAGVAGGIRQPQFADRDVALTCSGGSNQQQGQGCTERELHGDLRLHGLCGCQKMLMRGGDENFRCWLPACRSRTLRSCDRSLERP